MVIGVDPRWLTLSCALSAASCLTSPAQYAQGGSGASGGVGAHGGSGGAGGASGGAGGQGDLAGDGGSSGGDGGGAGGGASPFGPFEPTWLVHLGAPAAQSIEALAIDPQGGLVVGGTWYGQITPAELGGAPVYGAACMGTGRHGFVARVDATGALAWLRCFGDDATVLSLRARPDGKLAVGGAFADVIGGDGNGLEASAGAEDGFYAVMLPDGSVSSLARLGGVADDRVTSVAWDDEGNVVLGGTFGDTVDFGGGVAPTSLDGADAFVTAREPETDAPLFTRVLAGGGPSPTVTLAVRPGTGTPIFIAGSFEGTLTIEGDALEATGGRDLYVTLLDGEGVLLGAERWGGPGDDVLHDLTVAPSAVLAVGAYHEALTVGGLSLGPGDGSRDAFVARFEPNGAPVALFGWAGPGDEAALAAGLSGAGRAVVGGSITQGAVSSEGASWPSAEHEALAVVFGGTGGLASPWPIAFGDEGPDEQEVRRVDFAPDGSLIVAGTFVGTLVVDGEPLASKGARDAFVARLAP